MSLYNILEVQENATTAEIRASYRRLAKKHHPDTAGGDEIVFRALKGAHDVLVDPERRKRYDETGETETPPDTTDAEAINAIDGWFVAVLDDELAHMSDAIDIMLRKCADERRAAVENVALGDTLEARISKLRARFLKKNPDQDRDIIGGLFDQKLLMIRNTREMSSRRIVILDAAKAILEGYSFTADQPAYVGVDLVRGSAWNSGTGLGRAGFGGLGA
jgi:curved DNA-binding protein CbpA